MADNYLNKEGLLRLWGKIKSNFVSKDGNKVLSDNNFTNALKSKLDGIASGANKYTLPPASASILGGVKAGSNVIIDDDGTISATTDYKGRYVVDVTTDKFSNPTADAEKLGAIATHYESGETCVLSISSGGSIYEASLDIMGTNGKAIFRIVDDTNSITYAYTVDTVAKTITLSEGYSFRTEKEDKSNKVASVSSSSTNEQYPSARCLYDAINNVGKEIGFVSSSLASHAENNTYFQESLMPSYVTNAISGAVGDHPLWNFQRSYSVGQGESLDEQLSIQLYPGVNRITVCWIYGASEYIVNSRSTSSCDVMLLSQTEEEGRTNQPTITKVSYSTDRVLTINVKTGTNGGSNTRVVYLLAEGMPSFNG